MTNFTQIHVPNYNCLIPLHMQWLDAVYFVPFLISGWSNGFFWMDTNLSSSQHMPCPCFATEPKLKMNRLL
jgi:hypothetical protein